MVVTFGKSLRLQLLCQQHLASSIVGWGGAAWMTIRRCVATRRTFSFVMKRPRANSLALGTHSALDIQSPTNQRE